MDVLVPMAESCIEPAMPASPAYGIEAWEKIAEKGKG
jgi:hypothetical protein